jgi:hypothetical protein
MSDYPIRPSDISTKEHFFDAFNNSETEVSAKWLVRLAQKNGDWRDFTKAEIDEFSKQDFWFNRLLDDGSYEPPIRKNEDGTYSFTHKFVTKCFLSSPAVKEVAKKAAPKQCPNCGGELDDVVQPEDSPLNYDQWDAVKRGGLRCTGECKKFYFFINGELKDGHND